MGRAVFLEVAASLRGMLAEVVFVTGNVHGGLLENNRGLLITEDTQPPTIITMTRLEIYAVESWCSDRIRRNAQSAL